MDGLGTCERNLVELKDIQVWQLTKNESETVCGWQCGRKCCSHVFEEFSLEEREIFEELFYVSSKSNVKKKLLAHLYSQLSCGLKSDGFVVNNHTFCLGFLAYQTNVSKYILKNVMEHFSKGRKYFLHGNSGVIRSKAATNRFIAWLKKFCESCGQSSPDENIIILSYWQKKSVLYETYIRESEGPHLAMSTFYANFKLYFGANRVDPSLFQIRISEYSSHSKCTTCAEINEDRRRCRTEFELQVVKEKMNSHRLVFTGARRAIDEIVQAALSFPSDNLGTKMLFGYECISDYNFDTLSLDSLL